MDFSMYFVVMFAFAGTRFRPLSFNVPKPLFPLAGQPMVHHPISACKRVYTIGHHSDYFLNNNDK